MTTAEAKEFFDRTTFLRPPTAGEPLHDAWARMHSGQQALLATDGSMTLLLGGLYGEAITIQLLNQGMHSTTTADPQLQLTASEPILRRTVLLKTAETRRIAAYAESSIVMHRLPDSLQRDLRDGDRAIGLVLRDHKIPTIRYLEAWGKASASHAANSYLRETDVTDGEKRVSFYRSYVIAANIPGDGKDGNVPIMRVTEYFPLSLTRTKEIAV
jgi:chorismate-pyruvate lyase